jgi:hypothetical protein
MTNKIAATLDTKNCTSCSGNLLIQLTINVISSSEKRYLEMTLLQVINIQHFI